jgi:hypothetical protein
VSFVCVCGERERAHARARVCKAREVGERRLRGTQAQICVCEQQRERAYKAREGGERGLRGTQAQIAVWLLYCCVHAALLLLYCCFTDVLLLLYCCLTAALLQGYGGLYGVGKAATCAPRLMTLKYEPEAVSAVTETVALVGKGIVYDTGALRFFSPKKWHEWKHAEERLWCRRQGRCVCGTQMRTYAASACSKVHV